MSELMIDGMNLALYGMGFVFIFLILLVILTNLMSSLVRRYMPAPVIAAPRRNTSKRPAAGGKQGSEDQGRLVAVISAAIRQHRSGADE